MKILYISSFDIAGSNGPGVNEYETTRELIRILGDEVHFIIPEPSRPLEIVEKNPSSFTLMRGINNSSASRVFTRQKLMIDSCMKVVKTFCPDMLLFRPVFCPYAQIKCADSTGLPYVVKTLGIGVYNPTQNKRGLRGLAISGLQKLNEIWMKKLINGAMAIDVVTTEYKQFFSNKYPKAANRIFLVENAVNTDIFKPMDKNNTRKVMELDRYNPIIGYTGGSPYNRGGKLMIENAEKLAAKFPNIGIVIVGPKDEQLISAYDKSPVKEHIVLTGKVPYEKVPYYINCFDVCVSCDTPEIIAQYGNSSQKLRQYLACGKPVLSSSTQNTGFIEELHLGEVITDMRDSSAFGDLACRMLSMTDADRMELSNRATKYAFDNLSVRGAFAQRMRIWENAYKNI